MVEYVTQHPSGGYILDELHVGMAAEKTVHVTEDRIEVIRRLGEQTNSVLGDVDGLLCGHADVEFVEDVTARRVLCDVFDHGRALSQVRRNGEPHHASSSAA